MVQEALSRGPPASSPQSERRPLTLRWVSLPAWALLHVVALHGVTAACSAHKVRESASRRPRPRDSPVTSSSRKAAMDTHPVPQAVRHHLARMTDTLKRTTRVWHGVMGAPLVATLGTETFRPSGVDPGHGATVAFFESRPPGRSLRKPAGTPDARAEPCAHVSLHLPDEAPCPGCGSASWRTAARSPGHAAARRCPPPFEWPDARDIGRSALWADRATAEGAPAIWQLQDDPGRSPCQPRRTLAQCGASRGIYPA